MVRNMPNINKVLYNVDQTPETSADERKIARKNIGYHELVGHANDGNIGETTRVAPLNDNGYVPAEYLPPYVDDVVEGYYHNGKFYEESSYTREIPGERDKIYVDISDPNKGVGYRWTGSTFILISGQDTFSFVKIGDKTIAADQVMDTLEISGADGIKLAVDETNDKFSILHTNSIASGTIGSKPDVTGQLSVEVPWADYDSQGHITDKGSRTIGIAEASLQNKGVVQLTSTPGDNETMAITPKGVAAGVQTAIEGLDGNITGTPGSSKTLTALSETNGVMSATFGDIAINASQVTSGTLPVARGGTGISTATNVNSVLIGNSTNAAQAMQTVATKSGAFYATGQNAKPQFGTLPIAQGGTGVSTAIGTSYRPVYLSENGIAICDEKASVPYIDMTQQEYAQFLAAEGDGHGGTKIGWVPFTTGRGRINVSSRAGVEDLFANHHLAETIAHYHDIGIIPYVLAPNATNAEIYCYESDFVLSQYGTCMMTCIGFYYLVDHIQLHRIRFGRSGNPQASTTYIYEHTTTDIYNTDISGTYGNNPGTVYFL